ncbi:hypothetical protein CC78DRAFT_620289 [Lojkania enalia]|uniref:Uncharacterized protein n=1 Tax=Lojkania enalia TaxID=147567 RepID=A0A9P4K1A8_9PLEO|nr:hypothetical protein CC78DRAFT_620289 [Didymosphaeria enalia]
MAADLKRPALTRNILKQHNIIYEESIVDNPQLPNHVRPVQEALIDFSHTKLPNNWKKMFGAVSELYDHRTGEILDVEHEFSIRPPKDAWLEKDEVEKTEGPSREEGWEHLQALASDAVKIAYESRSLRSESEAEWVDFMRRHFFKRFQKRRQTILDEYSLEENVSWTASNESFKHANFNPSVRQRSGPRPDLTYGFQAHEITTADLGFRAMPLFRSLYFGVLQRLYTRQDPILSTVTMELSTWKPISATDKELPEAHKLCFPWAIVEVNHAQDWVSEEEYCYCQLANATACAYNMQEKLIQAVDDSGLVDPIIGFTCIGPEVRLWLTFRDQSAPQNSQSCLKMVSIWATSLDYAWGVLALRTIIKNMLKWATRILKGKLTQYIDWVYRAPNAVSFPITVRDGKARLDQKEGSSEAHSPGTNRTIANGHETLNHGELDPLSNPSTRLNSRFISRNDPKETNISVVNTQPKSDVKQDTPEQSSNSPKKTSVLVKTASDLRCAGSTQGYASICTSKKSATEDGLSSSSPQLVFSPKTSLTIYDNLSKGLTSASCSKDIDSKGQSSPQTSTKVSSEDRLQP